MLEAGEELESLLLGDALMNLVDPFLSVSILFWGHFSLCLFHDRYSSLLYTK